MSTALHALVGAPCLVKLGHDSEVQGRIVAISVECLLDDLILVSVICASYPLRNCR